MGYSRNQHKFHKLELFMPSSDYMLPQCSFSNFLSDFMKKSFFLIFLIQFSCISLLLAQNTKLTEKTKSEIVALIDSYSPARDKKDTVLLKSILAADIDQLVSTGEWREGFSRAVEGMQRSSTTHVDTRTLTVEKC